jgi:type IV pilus assembly protein PilY1
LVDIATSGAVFADESAYVGTWTITCPSACGTAFTFGPVTQTPASPATGHITAYQSSTPPAKDPLINWLRGQDNFGDEAGPGGAVTVRPSLHGDVLHSRPVVINYGGSTGVIVYYGANDGVYRAVNGNQSNPAGSTLPVPGSELWGFIPTEFYGKLNRLRTNSPQLLLPSTPNGILPAPMSKDYYADGTTNTAYIYLAMRRGGQLIYALDVSNPTNPQFLWKIDPTGLTNSSGYSASSDYAELGQTWSAPKVAQLAGYANPVLIFGAGYDAAEDLEPPVADSMGRGIFIVDATTGALVWSATPQSTGATACSGTASKAACLVSGMNYSMPADITLVDRDGDGKIDRLYAVDVGGNVWRVDLQPTAAHNTPNYWQVNKLAALGCSTGTCAAGSTPRKFFYPADVIFTPTYDAVMAGQGDREHPLFTDAASGLRSRLFMLKDSHTGNDGSGSVAIIRSNLFDGTSTKYDGSLSGYYLTLGVGEKVVNAPLTVAGYTYFGTNQPTAANANSCSANLGVARGYKLAPFTATYTSSTYAGGGLPPSPVAGLVNIVVNVNGVASTRLVPFLIGGGGDPNCVGADCMSALGGGKPTISVPTSRSRTYWYQEMD